MYLASALYLVALLSHGHMIWMYGDGTNKVPIRRRGTRNWVGI